MCESSIIMFSIKGNDVPLAKNISSKLGITLGEMECRPFANKETKISFETSVRNKHVYVLQVMHEDPNDCIMELLMMVYALKTACCRRVTAVVPYLPYSKQSKMRNRGSIPAKLLATLLSRAGVDHMLTMDLHSKEVQGFYDCPVDNLRASPFLIQYIQEWIPNYQNAVIVAKHPGGAARANSFAERLQLNLAVLHGEHVIEDSDQCDGRHSPPPMRKSRNRGASESFASSGGQIPLDNAYQPNIFADGFCSIEPIGLGLPTKVKKPLAVVGEVKDKIVIVVEAIVDDAEVICNVAKTLKASGALAIYVVATHGLFSGNSLNYIMESSIDEVIVTNTLPLETKLELCPKIRSVDISTVLSEAVRRINNGESMSYLFRNIPLED